MRHQLSKEDCSKGGKIRKAQASYPDACRKGFQVTMERYPLFARKHLKAKIRHQYPNGRVYREE